MYFFYGAVGEIRKKTRNCLTVEENEVSSSDRTRRIREQGRW